MTLYTYIYPWKMCASMRNLQHNLNGTLGSLTEQKQLEEDAIGNAEDEGIN